MQKRFADDGKTNKSKSVGHYGSGGCDDCNERDTVKGFRKLTLCIFFFIAVLLFKNFCFDVVTVSGNSMFDTLKNEEVLVVQMQNETLNRGDIVIAKVGNFKVIKRIIALPNETVQIVDGKVYIDGVVLEEIYCDTTEFAGVAKEPYRLSENEYFLMGDNRSGSEDSRVYGGVNIENIRGVATYRIYPFGVFGKLSHDAKGDI